MFCPGRNTQHCADFLGRHLLQAVTPCTCPTQPRQATSFPLLNKSFSSFFTLRFSWSHWFASCRVVPFSYGLEELAFSKTLSVLSIRPRPSDVSASSALMLLDTLWILTSPRGLNFSELRCTFPELLLLLAVANDRLYKRYLAVSKPLEFQMTGPVHAEWPHTVAWLLTECYTLSTGLAL